MKKKLIFALSTAVLAAGLSFGTNHMAKASVEAECSCDASTDGKCVVRTRDCTTKGTGAAKGVGSEFY